MAREDDDDIFRNGGDERDEDDGYEDGDGGDYDFQAERAAGERTGKRQALGDFIIFFATSDKKEEELQRRLLLAGMSDEERFTRSVGIYAKMIFEEDIGEITGRSKEKIENLISKLPQIKYKNPVAFLLAYYVTKKDKQKNEETIDKDKMRLFLKICERNGIDMTKEDIIRYFRLLQTL